MVRRRIAIIPARGGSRRIPRKNVMEFMGRPLIAATIEAAIDSGVFDEVLVSTDDPEIADISKAAGASAPFLRASAADDHSPVSAATIHALAQAESHWGTTFDVVAQLMPNCPLRGAPEIRAAMECFERSGSQFQISCFKFGWMNPWWAVRLHPNGHPERLFEDRSTRRSQDLDTLYCPTGAIWIADAKALRVAGTFYGPGHIYAPMHWTAAVDIDDMVDFEMAIAVTMLRATAGAVGD